jgi:hypothetical protein
LILIFLFFQLVFDNYTTAAGPSDTSPAASHSRRTPADDFVDDSLCANPFQELAELRQQLHSTKRQAVVVMEQSRKSLGSEQAALQQAQEALKFKETATAEAVRATKREEYMLDLLTDVSLDMAGMLYLFFLLSFSVLYFPSSHLGVSFTMHRLLRGRCCQTPTC